MSHFYDLVPSRMDAGMLTAGDLTAALERAGAPSLGKCAELLRARWQGMAEDEALADAGALIEQILDILDAHAVAAAALAKAKAEGKASPTRADEQVSRCGQRLADLLGARAYAA